jgi:hypothetical protein
MVLLPLRFIAPKILDAVKEPQTIAPCSWTHHIDQTDLMLDTSNWNVESGSCTSSIDLWCVNQELHTMQPLSEEMEEGFEPLSYSFAVSMIGQLAGKDKLIDYLERLQEVFKTAPSQQRPSNQIEKQSKKHS